MTLFVPFLLEINSVSARVLLFLVVPGHLIFFYLICLVEGQSVTSSKIFVLLYLMAGMMQVRGTVAETHSLQGFSGNISGPVRGTEYSSHHTKIQSTCSSPVAWTRQRPPCCVPHTLHHISTAHRALHVAQLHLTLNTHCALHSACHTECRRSNCGCIVFCRGC